MKAQLLTKFMVVVIAMVFCGVPEYVQALPQEPQNPQPLPQSGVSVDPSKGPLQPVPSQTQPASPAPGVESPSEMAPATPAPQPRPEQQMQEPLGAATAQGVPTVGGGASRPAGAAIAPDKQHQRHSLLLKVGALVAAGVAAGVVYGLSKGTSAKPAGLK